MKYVELGRTGLQCAQVSFGGIPIQRSDAANALAVVDALEEHGINYMDSARGYTVSEGYLGAALRAAGISSSWPPSPWSGTTRA